RTFLRRAECRGAYGVFQRVDPADALAGKASKGLAAGRQSPRLYAAHDDKQLLESRVGISTGKICGVYGLAERLAPLAVYQKRARGRPDTEGDAGRPGGQFAIRFRQYAAGRWRGALKTAD